MIFQKSYLSYEISTMQVNKLETSALLSLFENLQGTAREEFVKEVLKRSTFLIDVKFEVEESDAIDVAFVITVGSQKTTFQFNATYIKLPEIENLLYGTNLFSIADHGNGLCFIKIEEENCIFFVDTIGESSECIVPYAVCLPAFQKFYDWRSRSVMPSRTTEFNVLKSAFNKEILHVVLESPFEFDGHRKNFKLDISSLKATRIQDWKALLSGDEVVIDIIAVERDGSGPFHPYYVKDYVIQSSKNPGKLEVIRDFYRHLGKINAGVGCEFNLDGMKSAIQDIIAYLEANQL